MDPALITAICGGIAVIVGAFWGIIKYYDTKKENRMREERQASENRLREERKEHERIRQEEKQEFENRLEDERIKGQEYIDSIKEEREASDASRKELYSLVVDTLSDIKDNDHNQQQSINQLAHSIDIIENKINKLDSTINEQKQEMFENEKDRLRTAISDFANMVRGGLEITPDSYKYICHSYDKYKGMGGNSFIDAAMEYIKTQYMKGVNEEE